MPLTDCRGQRLTAEGLSASGGQAGGEGFGSDSGLASQLWERRRPGGSSYGLFLLLVYFPVNTLKIDSAKALCLLCNVAHTFILSEIALSLDFRPKISQYSPSGGAYIVNDIKVSVLGLGAMGSGIAKMVLRKKGLSLVGAYARREAKAGKDLAEVIGLDEKTGVTVTTSLDDLLAARADVVIHAVTSFLDEAYPDIVKILSAGQNIISIAEELAYPQVGSPDLTAKIDRLARAGGVSVLGTGINPGFVLDTLILTLTGACIEVKRIKASRVNDLSPFGSTVMRTQGVGTTVEEFEMGLANGTIVGHIGFPESITMIADALGWKLDEIVQTREPIVSNTHRETPYVKVEPGMVAGCRHIGIGMKDGEPLITLEHPQQIHPGEEGVKTGDYIRIEGTPEINMAIKPEIPGGIGTIALAVNMIPQLLNAEPGLMTMVDLPIPRALA